MCEIITDSNPDNKPDFGWRVATGDHLNICFDLIRYHSMITLTSDIASDNYLDGLSFMLDEIAMGLQAMNEKIANAFMENRITIAV